MHWLVSLARFERELSDAQRVSQRAEVERRQLADSLQEYEQAVVAAHREEETVAPQLRSLEREIKEYENRLARLHEQRDQVKDNKVFQTLNSEIDGLRRELDQRETVTLQAIELLESCQQQVTTSENALSERKVEITTRRAELQEASARAEVACQELAREIATCQEQLPPSIKATLTRLRSGITPPIVRLDGEACGGCHAQFPTQIAMEIDKGESVIRCQACGRYVVP